MTSSSSGVRSETCSAFPVGDPAGPGAGEAVGLRLVLDAAAGRGEAEPALHRVPELVGHDHRHEEPAVVGGQLLEQRAVEGDQVAGRVVVRVAGHRVRAWSGEPAQPMPVSG